MHAGMNAWTDGMYLFRHTQTQTQTRTHTDTQTERQRQRHSHTSMRARKHMPHMLAAQNREHEHSQLFPDRIAAGRRGRWPPAASVLPRKLGTDRLRA